MGVLTIRPGLRGCWNSTIVMRASRICIMNCPDDSYPLSRYFTGIGVANTSHPNKRFYRWTATRI